MCLMRSFPLDQPANIRRHAGRKLWLCTITFGDDSGSRICKMNQRYPVFLGVFDCPGLKRCGCKDDPFVAADSTQLVMQNLNHFALDWTLVTFAFNYHQKPDSKSIK